MITFLIGFGSGMFTGCALWILAAAWLECGRTAAHAFDLHSGSVVFDPTALPPS